MAYDLLLYWVLPSLLFYFLMLQFIRLLNYLDGYGYILDDFLTKEDEAHGWLIIGSILWPVGVIIMLIVFLAYIYEVLKSNFFPEFSLLDFITKERKIK